MVTPPPPIDDVTTADKENSSPASVLGQEVKGEKPKKKSAMFADTVEVLLCNDNLKVLPFFCYLAHPSFPKYLIFPRCATLIQVWWKQTT